MTKYVGKINPPISDTVSDMTSAPLKTKLKNIGMMFFGGCLIGGFIWGAGEFFDINWIKIAGYIVGGLICLYSFYYGMNAQIAHCPFCNGLVGIKDDDDLQKSDENKKVECTHCFEWLISNKGQVRAVLDSDLPLLDDLDEPIKIDAPVFENGKWPGECIVCGKPATDYQDAKKTKVGLTDLLIGKLSVQKASIKNIPYCKEHSDAVTLIIKDDHPRLVFTEYASRRRYIAVNKGFKVVKIK